MKAWQEAEIRNPNEVDPVTPIDRLYSDFSEPIQENPVEKIKEYAVTHFCMTSLNAGEVSLDDEIEVLATAGEHMNYETTLEAYLIETLMPFASAASQSAENEWKEAWEMSGADSGYSEYVPTSAEKFNWQDVDVMALQIGVSSDILFSFLANTLPGLDLHDFTVEWEDESEDEIDEWCRTFLLVSPE